MTGLLFLLGLVAYLTAYFAIGWRIARKDLPRLWERARIRWTYDPIVQSTVRDGTLLTVVFWPIRLPIIRMDNYIGANDPKRLAEEMEKRDQKIHQLETELGLRKRR